MITPIVVIWSIIFFVHTQAQCDRPSTQNAGPTEVPPTNPCIYYNGRYYVNPDGKRVSFDWSAVHVTLKFEGTSISVMLGGGQSNEYNVIIDGKLSSIISINSSSPTTYNVGSGLSDTTHTFELFRRTEANFGAQDFYGVSLDSGKWLQPNPPPSSRRLEFLGDSISCGYGDEGVFPCSFSAQTENSYVTYGAKIAAHFGAEFNLECWSGKGVVRNYGDSKVESVDPFPIYFNRTMATSSNIIWDFSKWVPSAVVVNLGTNDYSTNPYPPDTLFISKYNNFLATIRSKYGKPSLPIFLACGPMTRTPCCDYVKRVVADNPNNFYIDLTGVSGPLGCDYHPSAEEHTNMANAAIPVITKALNWG